MSPLDVFIQALDRASNPSNPPSAAPRSPDDPPPTAINPSLNRSRHEFDRFWPPHGAAPTSNIRWQQMSPDDPLPTAIDPSLNNSRREPDRLRPPQGVQWQQMSPVLETISSYQPPIPSQYDYAPPPRDSGPCSNFRDPERAESESRQRALDQINGLPVFGAPSNRTCAQFYPPQLGLAGEPTQGKPSVTDDLFSEVDEDELSGFEDSANQVAHQASGSDEQAPRQHPGGYQNYGLFGYPADFLTDARDNQPDEKDKARETRPLQARDFVAQPPSCSPVMGHPSPTESQLIAERFEFHNELPEEIQIAQFGDKAFRKALREVRPELPRKQQWYAWNKVRPLMNACPSFVDKTENPASESPSYAHSSPVEKSISGDHNEDDLWGVHAEPLSPRTTVLGRNSEGEENHAIRHQGVLHLSQSTASSSPVSSGHASAKAAPVVVADHHENPYSGQKRHGSVDRLREQSHGRLINERAVENRTRNDSEVTLVNEPSSDEMIKHSSQGLQAPAPTPTSSVQSQQEISGLSRLNTPRPDTPRPDSIRQSVEPETPYRDRVRESTPAFEDRSPSPSPVSHIGADVDMRDASDAFTPPPPVPPFPYPHPPPRSSPDIISSPIQTVTAPETPLPTSSSIILPRSRPHSPTKTPQPPSPSRSRSRSHSPSKPPPTTIIPAPIPSPPAPSSTPKSAKRGRRKSAAAAVASGKVDKPKSRSVTRKVTTAAAVVAKMGGLVKKEGGKVAEAVKRIEDGLHHHHRGGSPGARSRPGLRRSGRIAGRMV